MKKYKKSLFLFTRDYRLADNTTLITALEESEMIYPVFVFTHDQIDQNTYKSDNAVRFLVQSLEDLDRELHNHKSTLNIFHGDLIKILSKISTEINLDALYCNIDYTPYARERQDTVIAWGKRHKVAVHMQEDVLLLPLLEEGKVLNKQGKPYVKFTPFFNAARTKRIPEPATYNFSHYASKKLKGTISFKEAKNFYIANDLCAEYGGRAAGISILKHIDRFKDYEATRDFFALEGTTMLSAHLRFGTVSIREAFFTIKRAHIPTLLRQLYWRDFYTMLIYHMPMLTERGTFAYQPTWKNTHLSKILHAQTGVPLVDAGLNQLYKTGWMHNRVRMVVASFMTKNLLIDWKEGEKLYGRFLVDHDRCINLGNWHFMASTSAFSMMRSRLLNPYIQSKKFDNECIYIKKWLPQLKNVHARHIHGWEKYHTLYKKLYPAPIVTFNDSKKYFLSVIKKKV